jgi:hypothetical protein
MNKIIIAIATVVIALGTMITSSAQAGMKGKLGIGLAIGAAAIIANQHHRYEKRRAYRQRQHTRRKYRQRKVYATKKSSAPKKTAVAKVEPDPIEVPVQKEIDVVRQNSSITTAALPKVEDEAEDTVVEVEAETADASVDAPEVTKVADDTQTTANKLDCKKFFPSVGMTLSVPCE